MLSDVLRNLKRFLDFTGRTCCHRLLNKEGDTGKMMNNLHLDVSAGLSGTTEHRWTTDDEDTRGLIGRHVLEKLLKRRVYARGLISGAHKCTAFLL